MSTFIARELRFDVPGDFTNASIEAFTPPAGAHPRVTFSIARQPRDEAPFDQQAESLISSLPAALPQSSVLASRQSEVGHLPAYEVRVEAKAQGAAIYQRIALVDYNDTIIVLTASSGSADRIACDAMAEDWLNSLRFRDT